MIKRLALIALHSYLGACQVTDLIPGSATVSGSLQELSSSWSYSYAIDDKGNSLFVSYNPQVG